jgi:hypothetical protein
MDGTMLHVPAQETRETLQRAINWMRQCEEFAPDAGLYCDIAEASLLLRDFPAAQAYARHATLQASPSSNPPADVGRQLENDPNYERAFYWITESCYLAGNTALAQKYFDRFGHPPTLDAFKALASAMRPKSETAA